jgi:hypothetical protein
MRKRIKDIIVNEVPEPVATPYHVLVRPMFSRSELGAG